MIQKKIYICPEGQSLYRTNHKIALPEQIKYKNLMACQDCIKKEKCTKSSKGRVISRSKNQDFLDIVDRRTLENMDKYRQRQMLVEHQFGTVKRAMNAAYFLTRGLESVRAEATLIFLAYNMKRVINIMGVKEIIGRIKDRYPFVFYPKYRKTEIFFYFPKNISVLIKNCINVGCSA